ncbi:MAG TPA: four helix bundle protein [Terriglobales bacterium]|jgi:four helix bundle protein|nr:four helix bundle protein [Terriglobales bacterium]
MALLAKSVALSGFGGQQYRRRSGRLSKRDFRYFLSQARGSLFELETQRVIACRLGYISNPDLQMTLKQTGAIDAMLSGLMQSMLSAADGVKRETWFLF